MVKSTINYRMLINIPPPRVCGCAVPCAAPRGYGGVKKKTEKVFQPSPLYPDPGSNRDGLPHWCLRPARLPIPPSGQLLNCECKGSAFFLPCKGKCIFFEKKFHLLAYYIEKK